MRPTAPRVGATHGTGLVGAVVVACAIATDVMGCAATCPRYEDTGWRELTTANFRLRTDLGEAEARAKLESFETLRAALLTVFGAPTETRVGRTEVTVLDRGWDSVGGIYLKAFFTSNLGFPQIAMSSNEAPFSQDTVKHELVHQLSHVLRPEEPVWALSLQESGADQARTEAAIEKTLDLAADNPAITLKVVRRSPRWPGAITSSEGKASRRALDIGYLEEQPDLFTAALLDFLATPVN